MRVGRIVATHTRCLSGYTNDEPISVDQSNRHGGSEWLTSWCLLETEEWQTSRTRSNEKEILQECKDQTIADLNRQLRAASSGLRDWCRLVARLEWRFAQVTVLPWSVGIRAGRQGLSIETGFTPAGRDP